MKRDPRALLQPRRRREIRTWNALVMQPISKLSPTIECGNVSHRAGYVAHLVYQPHVYSEQRWWRQPRQLCCRQANQQHTMAIAYLVALHRIPLAHHHGSFVSLYIDAKFLKFCWNTADFFFSFFTSSSSTTLYVFILIHVMKLFILLCSTKQGTLYHHRQCRCEYLCVWCARRVVVSRGGEYHWSSSSQSYAPRGAMMMGHGAVHYECDE